LYPISLTGERDLAGLDRERLREIWGEIRRCAGDNALGRDVNGEINLRRLGVMAAKAS
jgi:hypothetical protein